MIYEIQDLLDKYVAWLKDQTVLRQVDDWVEITTPYLDRHNDHVQFYAKRTDGGFVLTDDGYTIRDLEMSGCTLDSRKRQDLLRVTLNGFGVQREGDALTVSASSHDFPRRKHNLVQAMLAVNDLFYLAQPMVASLFVEDVTNWFDLSGIRFTPNVKFTGKSGYDHMFDFVIPASRQTSQPERIVRAINRPNRENAESVAWAWHDTREVRPEDARAYAFLNDSDESPLEAVTSALRIYGLQPVRWSKREEVREELAA